MKHGDFTDLAKFYVDRPGYSTELLTYIRDHVMTIMGTSDIKVADIGAGTGKLTENLEQIGVTGYAVEPNDAMRAEGIKVFEGKNTFTWSKGSAETTNLPDHCVDWVLMGSSFHWVDAPIAMKEFKRILKPGGFFTAIWNPRNIEANELFLKIEDIVYQEIPNMQRISSGKTITTEQMRKKVGEIYKSSLIFMECEHEEIMSKSRYMNIWHSVNDIQVQAGEEGFKRILSEIEAVLKDYNEIPVPYKSRAWTIRLSD